MEFDIMAEIEVEREAMAAKRGQIMVYLLRTKALSGASTRRCCTAWWSRCASVRAGQ